MSDVVLHVVPIVEGHGDEIAVPVLLRRLAAQRDPPGTLEVLKPIRVPRTKLAKEGELKRAVQLAASKLRAPHLPPPQRVLVLVVADADSDRPCELGPEWLERARREDIDVAVVLANPEFETWFVAAADSLRTFLDLGDEPLPDDPEALRLKKKWIQDRFRGVYSETIDQVRMTQAMDLAVCRHRSASFDKLCRELAARLSAHPGGDAPASG